MALTLFSFKDTLYTGVAVVPYPADTLSDHQQVRLVWQGHNEPLYRHVSSLVLLVAGEKTNGWVLVEDVLPAYPDTKLNPV